MNQILINVGCGSTISTRWINIDKSLNAWISNYPRVKKLLCAVRLAPASVRNVPFPPGIRYRDIHKRGLPAEDSSVDWVYNSHLIPCMTREQTLSLFRETYRVLKPGGRTRIVTADLGRMARSWNRLTQAYMDGNREILAEGLDETEARQLTNGDLLNRKLGLHWFSRSGMPRWRRFFDYPIQYVYDFEAVKNLLLQAGFTKVEEKAMFESEMPDVREIETRPDSVYVEAEKGR